VSEPHKQRHIGRSIGAVVAGFVMVVVLSLGTDMLLVMAGIFPPFDQPSLMTNRLLVLATIYRTIYSVAGSYLTARLAPERPMAHALILGTVGLVVSILGAVVMGEHGPAWYPWALVVLALPGAWFGGLLYNLRRAKS
jgi:hypothetical protein